MAFLMPSLRPGLVALAALLVLAGLLPIATAQAANSVDEREVKVAFIYNFVLFAEWPAEVGGTLRLCLSGADRFGPALDVLQGRLANARVIELHRRPRGQSLKDCQVVFLADPLNTDGLRALDELRGLPVLTVGDSPGAAQLGVALNMVETSGRMGFEVNLFSARAGRIKISSKLLQLAREVIQ
jgi:hypothetical protein